MEVKRKSFSGLQNLSKAAALCVLEIIAKNIDLKGICTVVLSGGNTPRLLYEYFSEPDFAGKIPWQRTHFFWGDERCVPPNHVESNYHMASTAFLSKLPIPQANIHRIKAELGPPERAAAAYEKSIKLFFKSLDGHNNVFLPEFDLMLLGMGNDGHSASLFPGSKALDETVRWVVAASAPQGYFPKMRISMTLPVINNSRHVMFLISGRRKLDIINEIFDNRLHAAQLYPAARVCARQELIWFIDESQA